MTFVQLRDVEKTYSSDGSSSPVRVLREIDLQIREGEFVAVMGPSGCGKTTLLTVLGAMNRPTKGCVLIDEIEVYALREERRADFRREYVGFVFQQHHLLPFLTAAENVAVPLAVAPLSAAERHRRAMEALRRVHLEDKADRLPDRLSGGEQGRVAIARALVNEPPLLLADEPTGNLDSRTGAGIMDLFTELNRGGQTIVMVTHNEEYSRLAHRVVRMSDGRVQDRGFLGEDAPCAAPAERDGGPPVSISP